MEEANLARWALARAEAVILVVVLVREEALVKAEEDLARAEEVILVVVLVREEALVKAEEDLAKAEEALVKAEEALAKAEEALVKAEEALAKAEEALESRTLPRRRSQSTASSKCSNPCRILSRSSPETSVIVRGPRLRAIALPPRGSGRPPVRAAHHSP